jgi:hypothetical protein
VVKSIRVCVLRNSWPTTPGKDARLVKTNYKYEKRQKEIAKKKKKDQKLKEKLIKKTEQGKEETVEQPGAEQPQE